MNKDHKLIVKKLELWQVLSSTHPDDLSSREMSIWGELEWDEDIIAYLADCNKKKKYLDFEVWATNKRSNDEDRFSKDSKRDRTGSKTIRMEKGRNPPGFDWNDLP